MTPNNTKHMDFRHAWFHLLNGKRVRLSHWAGYWEWKNNTIMIHTREGEVLDIRDTDNVAYTFSNIATNDWEVAEEESVKEESQEVLDIRDTLTSIDTERNKNVYTRPVVSTRGTYDTIREKE